MQKFLIDVLIFFIIIIGFFWYYGRANGWFKPGGLVFEYFKERRERKYKSTIIENEENNNEDPIK